MSRPRRFAALAVLAALLLTLPGCSRQTVQESAQVLTMRTVKVEVLVVADNVGKNDASAMYQEVL